MSNLEGSKTLEKNDFEKEKSTIDSLPDSLRKDINNVILRNSKANKLLSSFVINKNTTEYKIGLLQILLHVCALDKSTKAKIYFPLSQVNGKIDANFTKSMKYIYPLFSKLTEYSIKKLIDNIKSDISSKSLDTSNTVNNKTILEMERSKSDIIMNGPEKLIEEDGIDKITKGGIQTIYDAISSKKGAKDMLMSFLGKNTIDLNNSKDKIALLQIYIIGIDNAKRKIESSTGKYVYTKYYEDNKLLKPNGIFDSSTIYTLNYILPNFDNNLTIEDVSYMISNTNKSYFAKSIFESSTTNNTESKSVAKKFPEKKLTNISKEKKREILAKDRTYFVTKDSKALIIDYLDEPVFLRCRKYMMDVLKFDEATTAAICGSIFVESSFNQSASGDSGSAYGLCQWRLDRLSSLKKFANQNGSSYKKRSTQLEFIKHELHGDFDHVLTSMNSTNDVYKKAKIFMNGYEIPNSNSKINHISKRKGFSGAVLAEI